ncbi:MAG: carbohydrate-binding family 9-like protein, partial [Prevotella bivia]|nr:carbohydrate-binding family 9-like protein [Prevotella bivia]
TRALGLLRGDTSWELALVVPVSSFFNHKITELSGLTMKANFYKCGDKTDQPHFLSWQKVDLPKPDFHRPEFFGTIIFE